MTEYNVGDAVVDASHSHEFGTVKYLLGSCTQHPVAQPHQELQMWLEESERCVWRCSDDVAPVTV